MERRLSAIFAADMVGYSRLMEADEVGTLQRQKSHRAELFDLALINFHGRIVKELGDGVLVEFPSVVEAVQCAVDIQRGMFDREADVSDDLRIQYRIGINLGDIIIDDDDIFGDGVNVAARLEQLAEPGCICISGTTYDQLKSKVEVGYESLGDVQVKNIKQAVRAYKILTNPDQVGKTVGDKRIWFAITRRFAAIAAVLLVATIGVGAWWSQRPDFEPVGPQQMALELPEHPSIAVLPFTNLSSDNEQDYFTDGMTDDLLTGLSRLNGLFVISRNTSFTYKGKAVKVREVAAELGVRFVLEGSVRRLEDQFRINVQLIDAVSGYHVWAEKYDRQLVDVFALQDEVVGLIVASMAKNLLPTLSPLGPIETQFTNAYDLFLQGQQHVRAKNPESIGKAIPLLKKAVDIDPNFSRAYAALAGAYWDIFDNSWGKRTGVTTTDAVNLANKYLALAMLQPTTHAYRISADMALWAGDFDKAFAEIAKAVEADTNDADNYARLAAIQTRNGQPNQAEINIRKAMRLNPRFGPTYQFQLGYALYHQDRFEEARIAFELAVERQPDYDWGHASLVAVYGQLGLENLAKQALAKLNELRSSSEGGNYTVQSIAGAAPFRHKKDLLRYQVGLRKGGVPDDIASESIDFETLVTKSGKGFSVKGVRTIDLDEAIKLHAQGTMFIDTRSRPRRHIPGTVWLDYKTKLTKENLALHAEKDTLIVFYCDGFYCYKSAYACAKAATWGYTNVLYFAGGFPAWDKAGLETVNR